MEALSHLRVILVHDWLTGMRGGEKCLEVFCRRWPDALLYTLLHRVGSASQPIERLRPRTSFLQRVPLIERCYRYFLPLMPRAVSWKLPACDLVISSSHCVAKGVRPPPGAPHICYCFTPMRYAWHMKEAYFQEKRGWKAWLRDKLLGRLREWDRRTAQNVTHFIAISNTVQKRIADCYGRDSVVIYPPVDTEFYCPGTQPRQDYYLVFSAFAPYKRLDLAILACNRLGRQLVVIGTGQDEGRLRALAGPTVDFLGWQPDEEVRRHLRCCRALLFPGEEDFGIVPLEAHACGAPVIAYGQGGATETVVPPGCAKAPTGLWFADQTVESLTAALEEFERRESDFDPRALRRQAERFAAARFEREFMAYVAAVMTVDKKKAA